MNTDPPKSMAAKRASHQPTSRVTKTNGKRSTSKTDQLVRLLSRNSGADITTLCETFGWKAHSVRAAISRLRKSGNVVVMSPASNGKPSRYRILTIRTAHSDSDAEKA